MNNHEPITIKDIFLQEQLKLMKKPTKLDLITAAESMFRQEHRRLINAKLVIDDSSPEGFAKHCQEHLLFISLTFRRSLPIRKLNPSKGSMPITRDPEKLWQPFDRFDERLCREVIGSHYPRKEDLQPFIFACFDDQGSKHSTVDLSNASNPHFHALAMIYPETLPNLSLATRHYLQAADERFDSLHWEFYNPFKNPEKYKTVPELIAYCCKALRPDRDGQVLYQFYPEQGVMRRKIEKMEAKAMTWAVRNAKVASVG